jgi:predicted glycoside hydrolase/deacetylase ChbG (UPF0249 family)
MPLGTIVINADDFGISGEANREISRCMIAGRITSTTLMANQGGFDEAVDLAKKGGFIDRIGVHLNFSTGLPLSDLPSSLRDQNGAMHIPSSRIRAPRAWVDAVEAELRAQVGRVVDSGIRPTHFDSHEHWHNSFPWTRAVMRVAVHFGVSKIRLARNCYYQRSPVKTGFKLLYNWYLARKGFVAVRTFTDVKPWFHAVGDGGRCPRSPLELMCHPAARLVPSIGSWNTESDLLLSAEFGACIQSATLLSYRDLKPL